MFYREQLESNHLEMVKWEDVLPLLNQENSVISVIGAGGKSSFIHHIGSRLADKGKRVLVTTTTHIWQPADSIYGHNIEEVRDIWQYGSYAVIGELAEYGKLKMPNKVLLKETCKEANIVLVEADGAKGYSCKIANDKEPVLLANSTAVVVIVGIDSIGQDLKSGCFRYQLAKEFLGKQEQDKLEVSDIAKLVEKSVHEVEALCSSVPCYVVINKCDDEERKEKGLLLLQQLNKLGIPNVMLASMKRD